jgi:hypothetical protein
MDHSTRLLASLGIVFGLSSGEGARSSEGRDAVSSCHSEHDHAASGGDSREDISHLAVGEGFTPSLTSARAGISPAPTKAHSGLVFGSEAASRVEKSGGRGQERAPANRPPDPSSGGTLLRMTNRGHMPLVVGSRSLASTVASIVILREPGARRIWGEGGRALPLILPPATAADKLILPPSLSLYLTLPLSLIAVPAAAAESDSANSNFSPGRDLRPGPAPASINSR